MAKDYGIKVSKPGVDVFDANPEELVFSSKYKTLKISARGSGTLTDAARTATIAHGLGYVPFFLVHSQLDAAVATDAVVGDNTDFFINPFRLSNAIDTWEDENTHDIVAWADSTNLYIIARDNVGKEVYPIAPAGATLAEQVAYEDDFGYTTGSWVVGNDTTSSQNIEDGAVRTNAGVVLANAATVYKATLNLYVGGRVGSGEVKMTISGIDEDNTAAFDTGTAATARTKTTANVNHNTTLSAGGSGGANVKSIVEEIVARGGWASGNFMGFILNDNGTTASNDYYEPDGGGSVQSSLEIMKSSDLVGYKYTIFLNQVE